MKIVIYFALFQIICSLLSISHYQDQEVVSINGASAALMLSDIPWNGPIGELWVWPGGQRISL